MVSSDLAAKAFRLFEASLAIDAAERDAWVRQACAGEAALFEEVASLLNTHVEAQGFLGTGESDEPTDASMREGKPDSRFRGEAIGPGVRLDDFLIEKQIGAGGMGVVYQAQQISLNRRVALKILPSHLRYSTRAQSRFRHEIEAAAGLHHTNIISVYTTGEAHGSQYYAMELVDGPPLSALIQKLRDNPLPELKSATARSHRSGNTGQLELAEHSVGQSGDDVLSIDSESGANRAKLLNESVIGRIGGSYFDFIANLLADVADGLAYAHQQGVVHRDIKPSNLLFSRDGRLHVSDFGLARILEQPGITHTGEFVGTPLYMSPEQIASGSKGLDGRTDIYALGATLYELLTLRPPFPGDSRDQVIAQITRDEPQPPRRLNKRVPRDLETLCLKALEKDPADRYQRADHLAADLRAYASRYTISAKRAGVVSRTYKWVRRHRALSAAFIVVLCLGVTAGFFAVEARRSHHRWVLDQQDRVVQSALIGAIEGDLEAARSGLEEGRRLGLPPGRVLMIQGATAMRERRNSDAYEYLSAASSLLPDDLSTQLLCVMACMADLRQDEAAARWHVVEDSDPVILTDYLYKAYIERRINPDRALKTLDGAIRAYPDSVTARMTRGDVHLALAQDSGDPVPVEASLVDYATAAEFIGVNPVLLNKMMRSHLTAAVLYEAADQPGKREEHLGRSAQVSERLEQFPDDVEAYYWRSHFLEYAGDHDRAIQVRLEVKEHQIMHLVLMLFQQGRFEEAVTLCDERAERYPESRWTDFLRALILTATESTPRPTEEALYKNKSAYLDPLHSHLFTNTILCLSGDLDEARREARGMLDAHEGTGSPNDWFEALLEYATGTTDSESLLAAAGESRIYLNEAHYYIGLTELASGRRETARDHFEKSARLRIFTNLNDALSRAFLAQMERDPDWPVWITQEAHTPFGREEP